MTAGDPPRLSIFDKFKTRTGELTTRARRQRFIIRILAESPNPSDRTRIAISRNMAAAHGTKWQASYPGVFKDMEEVMIPLDLIVEEGRLPMKRGPRVLQEQGSPFYKLTRKGTVVALSVQEIAGRADLLEELAEKGNEVMRLLTEGSPSFMYSVIQRYVEAWCDGELDLMPFDLTKIGAVDDQMSATQLEMLTSFSKWNSAQKAGVLEFLGRMSEKD